MKNPVKVEEVRNAMAGMAANIHNSGLNEDSSQAWSDLQWYLTMFSVHFVNMDYKMARKMFSSFCKKVEKEFNGQYIPLKINSCNWLFDQEETIARRRIYRPEKVVFDVISGSWVNESKIEDEVTFSSQLGNTKILGGS